MRLNRFIAQQTDISRRKADALIDSGDVVVDRQPAHPGMDVSGREVIIINGRKLKPKRIIYRTIALYKPVGYVCSRDGQGSPTVYDLLPGEYHHLNVAGRLDKDSSGLVILTNNGKLMQELTHPSNDKQKTYTVELNRPLEDGMIAKLAKGVDIGDARVSKLMVAPLKGNTYEVNMQEGRNRQIRRSFEAIGYQVSSLHRTRFGPYRLEDDHKIESYRIV